MKKKFTFVVCLLAAVVFSGCGSTDKVVVKNIAGEKDDSISIIESTAKQVITRSENTAALTDAENNQETAVSEENSSAPSLLSDGEAVEMTKMLMEGTMYLNNVILCGGLTANTSVSYMDENGNYYSPVVNDNFSTVQELKDYILHYITEDYYNSYRSGLSVDYLIFEGTAPVYADFDDCLCINTARMWSGMSYKWDYDNAKIYANRENYVEINLNGTAGGESYDCIVVITTENDAWKVDGVMIS